MSDEEDVPAWDGPIIRPKSRNGSSSAKSARDHRHSRDNDRHRNYPSSRDSRDRSQRDDSRRKETSSRYSHSHHSEHSSARSSHSSRHSSTRSRHEEDSHRSHPSSRDPRSDRHTPETKAERQRREQEIRKALESAEQLLRQKQANELKRKLEAYDYQEDSDRPLKLASTDQSGSDNGEISSNENSENGTSGSSESEDEESSNSDASNDQTDSERSSKSTPAPEEDLSDCIDENADEPEQEEILNETGEGEEDEVTPTQSPLEIRGDGDSSPRPDSVNGVNDQDEFLEPANSGDELNETDEMDTLPEYRPSIEGCRNVAEFECLNKVEEGTYGIVYRARDIRTNEIVALKRLKMDHEREGFPITSLREINTLLLGQHKNVVTVKEIVVGTSMDKIFIVMDFVEHDMKSLLETMRSKHQVFLPGEVKCLMLQLLSAVSFLHDNWILHRDLKTSNLLLSHKGILKVGDFGLARQYGSPLLPYTPIVVTLWYRALELLLGMKEYSTHIDVWSVGCIFAEFLRMKTLFSGKNEAEMLNQIFAIFGSPNTKNFPGYEKLPVYKATSTWQEYRPSNLRLLFFKDMLSESGLSLLRQFFNYDPTTRFSCDDAMKSEYFQESPLAIHPSMFPTWPAKSELGGKKPASKTGASPKAPAGGDAYKKIMDENEGGGGFVLKVGAMNAPPAWNLKF